MVCSRRAAVDANNHLFVCLTLIGALACSTCGHASLVMVYARFCFVVAGTAIAKLLAGLPAPIVVRATNLPCICVESSSAMCLFRFRAVLMDQDVTHRLSSPSPLAEGRPRCACLSSLSLLVKGRRSLRPPRSQKVANGAVASHPMCIACVVKTF
jgi:hypothetical protein